MAKDAYYFSHDSNARTDPKILSMISDYGIAGYGMWWVLVEMLREQDEYKLKHNKCTWKSTAMQMQCKSDEVQKFIDDCVEEYELLEQITKENGDNYVYSPSLLRRMGKLDIIRAKRAQAANSMWDKKRETMQNDANALQVQSNSMQSKPSKPSKPSKEKESKKEYAPSVTFTLDEYKKLIDKFGLNILIKKIEDLSLYKQSTGKKYASDYATILAWDRKDKKNIPEKINTAFDEYKEFG